MGKTAMGKTAMGKTVVISFGTEAYRGSLDVLRHSALRTAGADECVIFTEKDVEDFFETYPDHLEGSRGYGWWAWKAFLLRNVMSQRPDGDVIVYCDSTMIFEKPLASYVAETEKKPIVLTRLGGWSVNDYRNVRWTKRAVFDAMHPGWMKRAVFDDMLAESDVGDDIQLNAAFQMYRNGPEARAFVDEYLRWCTRLDVVNDAGKGPECVDTRHDQSILSLLAYGHPAVTILRDVTQHGTKDPRHETDVVVDDVPLVDHHRKLLRIPTIAVITPTIGGEFLRQCIDSVQASTLPGIEHWIITDGEEHRRAVDAIVGSEYDNRHPIVRLTLPKNVGANGWNGHRVYGSFPWLVNTKYVAFLDEDNTVDPGHYKNLVAACVSNKVPWAYSLRRIIDHRGEHVCVDACESIGGISHTVIGPGDYLVDTSCYLIDRDLAVKASVAWNSMFRNADNVEADRELAKTLLSSAPYAVVRKHSLAYRLGSTDRSVAANFFTQGNRTFGHDFENKKDLYIFHFSRSATAAFLETRRDTSRSYALDEWQPTLLRGLQSEYNLIDGFSNAPNIPTDATVLVSLCNPAELPLDLFAARTDLKKIVYTLESPNIRHAAQWKAEWIRKHFDVALTYWKPLLDDPRVPTVFAAHNCHHGDFENPLDRAALLRTNVGRHRECVMVLERRPELFHTRDYAIDGVHLRCLDHLREDLVRGLRDVTVFGVNWGDVADGKNIKLGHALHRSKDPRSAVDIVSEFTFVVIVENTDAAGYTSEKLYDAFSAGAIPLYYGSTPNPETIPEGPESGVYIDLRTRGIATGKALQEFLDVMGDSEIEGMKTRIVRRREDILRSVDVRAFATSVTRAMVVAERVVT